MSRKEGQVAVILILVTAAALIFYAVSLNLGRVSQTKVVTTIAADTGASTLASFMASFGQSIFQTSLGGKKKVCGWTGVLVAIIAVIIAIIAVVTQQYYWLAVVSAILALAALVIQVAVIQPGLSDKFNEIIWHTMDSTDAFTEQGVQKALTAVATDPVQVPDLDDSDQDRVFGLDVNGDPLDKVSRFGFYYTQRLNTIPVPVSAEVQDFLDALRNFLLDNGDNWGLFDDTGPVCTPFSTSSECNPCCLPLGVRDSSSCGDTPVYDSEGTLIEYTENPGIRSACEAGSPYGDGTISNYPWVYDAYRGNPTNTFVSVQEQLGRDDEHRDFRKNPLDPNGLQTSVPGDGFRLEDTTGFHDTDNRDGVFPFFYKTADWGMNLDFNVVVTNDALNPQCNWCAAGGGTTCDVTTQYSPELSQLVLPLAPSTLTYNTSYCVDGINSPSIIPGRPPLAVDLVRLPDLTDAIWTLGYNGGVNDAVIPLTGKIEADAAQCAQTARGDPDTGFWKRGGDMFCSAGDDAWPYYGQCPKFGTTCTVPDGEGGTISMECACGEGDALPPEDPVNGWPDDLLDELIYGLNSFADWAREILAKDAASLGSTFSTWYPDAAGWIEPGSSTDPLIGSGASATAVPYCYICEPEDGMLHVWWKQIQEMQNRLHAWHDTSFASSGCSEVWCVPDAGCPGPFGKDSSALGGLGPEEDTFDSNGNTTPGDIADVAACLNWNVNDTVTTSDTVVTATGNAAKLEGCYNACLDVLNNVNISQRAVHADELCQVLPRSLVPNFDAIAFVRPTPALLVCDTTCSDCITACAGDAACIAACACGSCACSDAACLSTQTLNAKGSCANTAPGGFMDLLGKSVPEAQNQAAKFRQRYTFLSGRLAEMDNLLSVLDGAEEKFREFLTCADTDGDGAPDGAACNLTKARIDFDSTEHGLPYHAIYGWQSEPAEKGKTCEDVDPVDGKPDGGGCTWHIARVDARIPERCDRACNVDQTPTGDPPWPFVKTFTKSLGMKRCYELKGTDGVVKVRVSRFDEASASPTLLFPNAVEIWKQIFSRSDRPPTASSNPEDIESACIGSMVPNPGDALAFLGSNYYGAFMLNKRLDNVPDPGCLAACAGDSVCETACANVSNADCWDLANHLLSRGVTSEACAQYYFHSGTPSGMDFKFVPCLDF